MSEGRICAICGKRMQEFKGIFMCLECNDKYGEYYSFFSNAVSEFKGAGGQDVVLIDCPGASVYDESNTEVVRGVKWNDQNDFSNGYTIVGTPVFAPGHKPKRMVPKDKAKNIGRCQACQDFTVRMRIFNSQKAKGQYGHESPLLPKDHPREQFDPHKQDTWHNRRR
jgi:hypothetical protein